MFWACIWFNIYQKSVSDKFIKPVCIHTTLFTCEDLAEKCVMFASGIKFKDSQNKNLNNEYAL
jgi:hypothetical protein